MNKVTTKSGKVSATTLSCSQAADELIQVFNNFSFPSNSTHRMSTPTKEDGLINLTTAENTRTLSEEEIASLHDTFKNIESSLHLEREVRLKTLFKRLACSLPLGVAISAVSAIKVASLPLTMNSIQSLLTGTLPDMSYEIAAFPICAAIYLPAIMHTLGGGLNKSKVEQFMTGLNKKIDAVKDVNLQKDLRLLVEKYQEAKETRFKLREFATDVKWPIVLTQITGVLLTSFGVGAIIAQTSPSAPDHLVAGGLLSTLGDQLLLAGGIPAALGLALFYLKQSNKLPTIFPRSKTENNRWNYLPRTKESLFQLASKFLGVSLEKLVGKDLFFIKRKAAL